MNLYDVADTAIDSMVHERSIGYLSLDFKYRYLGSNETAEKLMPELRTLVVDKVIGDSKAGKKIRHYVDSFRANPDHNSFTYTLHGQGKQGEDDRIYNVNVNGLYEGNRQRGYIVTFTDDTANRKYIQLLDTYNEKLKDEVERQTGHIIEMHDNLIMSLAMMVESRDNSTGGHIKRTSEGVRILVEEMKKEGTHQLTEEFCIDVIKAAPMHDLGKIAVDDAILRKPGRFTDDEYEKMKMQVTDFFGKSKKCSDEREVAHLKIFLKQYWTFDAYPKIIDGVAEKALKLIMNDPDALGNLSTRDYLKLYDDCKIKFSDMSKVVTKVEI
jgi:putative two-component system response regulator